MLIGGGDLWPAVGWSQTVTEPIRTFDGLAGQLVFCQATQAPYFTCWPSRAST